MTTPLTDWAGNEIKDGQQIVIVDITDYNGESRNIEGWH